jgi:methylenetetrahydrofolate dehydrogenase (NADP+)/methenyltetrahydrofolate cyclohydrolase
MSSKDKIIDGKEFAAGLRKKIAEQVAVAKAKSGKTPGLAVILVGNDPASEVYVRNKDKQAKECGMNSYEYKLPADISEAELLKKVDELNNDKSVHGILVQLPLPKHLSELAVIAAISPDKDVDGFHDVNRAKLEKGEESLVPCTPLGCLMLIKDRLGNNLKGKKAVVVGRSNIVGKPMAQLLRNEGCEVNVCHSQTQNNPQTAAQAEILVVAVGKPLFIKSDWVRQGACVIDVGINRVEGNKLVGDVDYADAFDKAGFITPVPGGVGPMTIACLLNNTVEAYKRIEKISL